MLVTLTPVAALMFRFDNPDAMLVLLMTAAAYCVTRAMGDDDHQVSGRAALRWMIGAGLLIGFAFLTKMLQGLLVLPGLGLAYLVAARYSLKTRIAHLIAATVGVLVGAGWLIGVEALWPASARPYIGGSTNNSLWDLAIGYNGLGRILGGSGNAGGMGGGGGFGGTPGLLRMFNSQFGAEVSWLLPTSLILLVAGVMARGRAPRTDRARASLILWGGWLIVTLLCLSFMEGTVHSYYSVALVPAITACIAVGGHQAWLRHDNLAWRCVIAVSVCVAAVWSFRLLSTTAPNWLPWLRWVSVTLAVLGAMAFVALHAWGTSHIRRFASIGLIVGILGGLGGSTAWTFATITTGHTGSMPTAGPVAGGSSAGMGGGAGAPGTSTAKPASSDSSARASSSQPSGTAPTGQAGSGNAPSGNAPAGVPSGTKPSGSAPTAAGSSSSKTQATEGAAAEKSAAAATATATPGGGSTNNTALTALLNATNSRWSAAVVGDQTAAGYILSSNTAVMSIGGWSGTDNNVSLTQFQAYVKAGDIHYFIADGGMGGGMRGNSGSGSQITAWVKAHYKAKTVGGVTVYDLTQPTS